MPNLLILDPGFYNMLVSISRSSIMTLNADSPWNTDQPNIVLVEERFPSTSDVTSQNVAIPGKTRNPQQSNIALSVTVLETAVVMEAVINWLYEKVIPEDPEILPNIYCAACKYKLKDLRMYIESRIENYNDNVAFIAKMVRIALWQGNEEVLKRLVSIFKRNRALLETSEYTTLLNQHGTQLMEYFIE